jgi:DNA-binding XRE family transcriptional regulator
MGVPNYHTNRDRLLSPDYLRYMATDWVYIRTASCMNRRELAKAIGVSRPTIQHLEEHTGTPFLGTVRRLIHYWEGEGIVIPQFELTQVEKKKRGW